MKLTAKEESFCQLVAKYGHKEKVKAYKEAGYSVSMSNAAIQVQADKLYNKPKLNLRINNLTSKVEKKAEEKFLISVEQRLRWLKDIVDAGLEQHEDATGAPKRQNLPAANQAITILNSMLGTDEDAGKVKPVKVFIGVKDASRS